MRRLILFSLFLDDPAVTEIMVNGPDDIFIEREGRISKLNLAFVNKERLEDVIQTIVSKVN